MSFPITARTCRGITIDGGHGRLPVSGVIIASMALAYGAPSDVGPATPWHEVGTDICRLAFLDHVEEQFAVYLSDDQRESIGTLGDLISLVEGRADA